MRWSHLRRCESWLLQEEGGKQESLWEGAIVTQMREEVGLVQGGGCGGQDREKKLDSESVGTAGPRTRW